MCFSFVGQLLFGILMVIALGLTTVSMFLPGLKELHEAAANVSEDLTHFRIPKEFISSESLCRIASTDNAASNDETIVELFDEIVIDTLPNILILNDYFDLFD
ncbi:hypothetical protein LOAG_14012 [Loa loa]|uniref:Uncharacterized protein n=1 Tax=Loa loa TaxID=7209 RepID=A0A1S0TIH5_LOALO|nr:hypothetical protein LOAG_14012 [Loa loa]EFO14506.1 hypothetical protein LOAG_14012 [Loa loa]